MVGLVAVGEVIHIPPQVMEVMEMEGMAYSAEEVKVDMIIIIQQ